MLKRLGRLILVATLLAIVSVSTSESAGNGGFTVSVNHSNFDPFVELTVLGVNCNTGYTCGTVNIEVDWDDGSAIDDHVEFWSSIGDEEFEHEYQEGGTYDVELSLDDEFGNWETRIFPTFIAD